MDIVDSVTKDVISCGTVVKQLYALVESVVNNYESEIIDSVSQYIDVEKDAHAVEAAKDLGVSALNALELFKSPKITQNVSAVLRIAKNGRH